MRRAFAGVPLSELDPFVHMDQMGEVDYGPGEPKGRHGIPIVGSKPSRTSSMAFCAPGLQRRGWPITDGDTQWMTAGAGILHIEAPPESLVVSGGLFHGIQLWVNLPAPTSGSTLGTRTSVGGRRLCSRPKTGDAPPGDRRRCRRLPRAGFDVHTDHACPCHDQPYGRNEAAMAAGLQCSGLCPRRRGLRRRAACPVRTGQLVVFGPGDYLQIGAARVSGQCQPQPRGARARRPPHPRTRRPLRALRHEHQGGDSPGDAGLPSWPPREIPAEAMPHRHPSDVELPASADKR